MLVLESMRQFMGHDHALVGKRTPVRDVKFAGRRIVEPFDLFREHIDHERIEVESLGKESKGFGAALVGDRKSTRLNSSHSQISYAVFCLNNKRDTRLYS